VNQIVYPEVEVRAKIVGLPSASTAACPLGAEYEMSYQDLVERPEPHISTDLELLRFRVFSWSDGNWRFNLSADFLTSNNSEGTWASTRVDGAYLLLSPDGEVLNEGYVDVTNMVWLSEGSKRARMDRSVVVAPDILQRAAYLFVFERKCHWAVTMRTITS
jgi:hypothetical protein